MCVLCLPTLSPSTSAVVSFLWLFSFGGVSYNFICSPHLSLHDQQSSLYGEIEAWQYANCRERTRVDLEWFWWRTKSAGVSFIKRCVGFILKVYVRTKAWNGVRKRKFWFIKPCVCTPALQITVHLETFVLGSASNSALYTPTFNSKWSMRSIIKLCCWPMGFHRGSWQGHGIKCAPDGTVTFTAVIWWYMHSVRPPHVCVATFLSPKRSYAWVWVCLEMRKFSRQVCFYKSQRLHEKWFTHVLCVCNSYKWDPWCAHVINPAANLRTHLFSAECNNISAHMLVNEAQWA